MDLWRISRFRGLDGAGGLYSDARWHTKPRAVIYTAEHPALSMVEVMAHMRLDISNIPLTLRLIRIEVKARAKRSKRFELPEGWQANQPATQALGNAWIDRANTLLIPVPSAVVPNATNWLINVSHAQATTHLVEHDCGPFWFDQRMF